MSYFFVKQKTAYEMRISDWSSDVCSSDLFLTLGITAGSYWAYYELGWGGWWFWDPVEHVSLVPWLAGAALLHSVAVTATRHALRAWPVMLEVIGFSMSMRSEERRVGQECDSTCRSRWSQENEQKNAQLRVGEDIAKHRQ